MYYTKEELKEIEEKKKINAKRSKKCHTNIHYRENKSGK